MQVIKAARMGIQMTFGASPLVVNSYKLPKIINEKGDQEHVENVHLFSFVLQFLQKKLCYS